MVVGALKVPGSDSNEREATIKRRESRKEREPRHLGSQRRVPATQLKSMASLEKGENNEVEVRFVKKRTIRGGGRNGFVSGNRKEYDSLPATATLS